MGSLIAKRGAATGAARTPSAQRFKYQARSAEEVKARATRSLGGGDAYLRDGTEFFKSAPKENRIRPLPPTWDNPQHYGIDLWMHFGIGPDRSSYICPDKMRGDPCPICEERAKAAEEGEEALAKALKPKMRVLVWLIDRKNESKGPLAWAMPAGLDKDMANAAVDPDDGSIVYVDRPDEQGADLFFQREGEGIKTEYNNVRVTKKRPLADDSALADKWLEYVSNNPLPDILIIKTPEELTAALVGTTVEEKDGDKKAERPAAAKLPPRGAARTAAAPPAEPPPPAAAATKEELELPSWDEVHKASTADVGELLEAHGLRAEAEADSSIDSEAALADWACKRLGIEKPAPTPAATGTVPSWKAKLNKAKG